jgi:hypothetical protein
MGTPPSSRSSSTSILSPSAAPLLVSPDGKKAIFDNQDSKINVNGVDEAGRTADEERFRKRLEG